MIGKKWVLAILVFCLAYGVNKLRKIKGETVETKSGSVQGTVGVSRDGREFYEWRGIPYAEPPVGQLRFASPLPVKAWEGIKDASSYGSWCAQMDFIVLKTTVGKEDCLFLNIFTPKDLFHNSKTRSGKLLPVMFWIHGGYFHGGAGDFSLPHYFMDEDVILVTINYRVGVLGFLSTQDKNARGNMGLKDQSLALKWVKENIENFGGDHKQITVFGESAGGVSTHYQMISPMSSGLMTRAISQSGNVFAPWVRTRNPVAQARNFAKNVGCHTETNDALVQCLRGLDLESVLQGHLAATNPEKKAIDMFTPVIEAINDKETFLSADPEILYTSGKIRKIPWMTGITRDEGILHALDILRNDTFRETMEKNWRIFDDFGLRLTDEESEKYSEKIREFYFGHSEKLDLSQESTLKKYIELSTDRFLANSCNKSVKLHSRIAPVYPYLYDKVGHPVADLILAAKGDWQLINAAVVALKGAWYTYILNQVKESDFNLGVGHAEELALLFYAPVVADVLVGSPLYEFSKALVKTWASFAKGEPPVFKRLPFPKVTTPKKVKYMRIDDTPDIIDYPFPDRYKFWKHLLLD